MAKALWIRLVWAAVLLAVAAPALAAEAPVPPDGHAVGVNAVALRAWGRKDAPYPLAGATVSGETTVVGGWLRAELAVGWLQSSVRNTLPVALLAKKPFFPWPNVHAWLGLGPLVEWSWTTKGRAMYAGVTTAAGAHWWLAGQLGLRAVARYDLVCEECTMHEFGGELGLSWRF